MNCTACNATSREALVSWGDPEFTYTGRINDSFTWNGWSVPAFTAEEVRRMAKETAGVQGLCQIKEQTDGSFVIIGDPEVSDGLSGDDQKVEPTACCGRFFIGDWWTWAEVEPELGDLPQYTSAHLTEI